MRRRATDRHIETGRKRETDRWTSGHEEKNNEKERLERGER